MTDTITGSTLTARPPSGGAVDMRILRRVFMACGAMGLVSIPSAVVRIVASCNVLGMAENLKMVWTNTVASVANVVNGQPFGDRTNNLFVNPAMNPNLPPSTVSTAADFEQPVALRVLVGSPQPTGVGLFDLRPESFERRRHLVGHSGLLALG